MKKYTTLAMFLTVIVSMALAQTNMFVWIDGIKTTYPIALVDSVTFGNDDVPNIADSLTNHARVFTVNDVSFTMINVDGGSFIMGATEEQSSDADNDEYPTHLVTLSDYAIGETEVTTELWNAVMYGTSVDDEEKQIPINSIWWHDCQDFIQKLNELTGENFRLPTEAEWEYAARGGNKSNGYKYSGSNVFDDVASNRYTGSYDPVPVKQKQPNELGIYDMSGNVGEWCQDWYGEYSSSAQINPIGPQSGDPNYPAHVWRGGSSRSERARCRVSNRDRLDIQSAAPDLGLRLVLE